ncbi:hypothetical protein KGR20_23240 [Cytobacillus oceanisediminis]|uniref:Uncharacterized protein n=1 Tax=Niallia alba TaxID=2729105 RepID=A0A7Y0K4L6_9BACI|nr:MULTISPECIES: hypothetical protein [Bacillaceae]MBZ9537078.1 hypothetical protein [Cytobacillus oceanisediminis]NMO75713.1 hypothetical protein [Niallia alba]UTI43509.1 hypothetical protein NKG37_07485 [Niallia sp. RD1]
MKEQDMTNRQIKEFKPRDHFEFRDCEYVFIVARFENLKSISSYNNEDYSYFIYIFKQEHKLVDKNTMETKAFNVLCFHHVYQNFDYLTRNILPVVKEYILDKELLFDFIQHLVELDPELVK